MRAPEGSSAVYHQPSGAASINVRESSSAVRELPDWLKTAKYATRASSACRYSLHARATAERRPVASMSQRESNVLGAFPLNESSHESAESLHVFVFNFAPTTTSAPASRAAFRSSR